MLVLLMEIGLKFVFNWLAIYSCSEELGMYFFDTLLIQ